MGGSAIGGDLVRGIWSDRLRVPVEVVRGYDLPAWVGRETLVIASSKSGGTEETISALPAALERRCPVVVVTTGGPLKAVAEQAGPAARHVPGPRHAALVGGLLDGPSGRHPRARRGPADRRSRDRGRRRCRPRDGRPLRAGGAHRGESRQAAGLGARGSLRDHHRQRLPGPRGAALEGAAQRERQGHGRLRGAARGDAQHRRRLRAARVAARPSLRRLPGQRARPSPQRPAREAHRRGARTAADRSPGRARPAARAAWARRSRRSPSATT